MLRGVHLAFLPMAITFGALALLFLVMGESMWVVFLPLAVTFGVLTLTGRPDDDEVTDAPQPPMDGVDG